MPLPFFPLHVSSLVLSCLACLTQRTPLRNGNESSHHWFEGREEGPEKTVDIILPIMRANDGTNGSMPFPVLAKVSFALFENERKRKEQTLWRCAHKKKKHLLSSSQ